MSGKAKRAGFGKAKLAKGAKCTVRANFGAELANFKAMFRHIILNNADPTHQCLFTVD